MARSIYLDNAATTWPKPNAVPEAIARYYRENGVAAHRSTSGKATEIGRAIEKCRMEIARLINAESDLTIFCFNGTDALNLAIRGLVSPGNKVITTVIEHNSVLRPLYAIRKLDNLAIDLVPCIDGVIDLEVFESKISPDTDLCCVSHVSNVTGLIQPLSEIAELCKKNDVLLIVDACQSVGHLEIDCQSLGIDALVCSGHKGLMGPLGTGILSLSQRAAKLIRPTRLGGTGTQSESVDPPSEYPSRLEAGNLNVGGILGLAAGVEFIVDRGIPKIAEHESRLLDVFHSYFADESRMKFYGARKDTSKTGVLSFNLVDHDPQTVAALLDSAFGIQVRAGLHCAPLIHEPLGSSKFGGTVRISPGVFNTEEDIISLCDAVKQIIG